MLRQRDDGRRRHAKIGFEIPHLDGVRPQPRHQRGARRVADRLLGVRLQEHGARSRQPIDVGRLDVGVAEDAERGTQVVDRDEEHVGTDAAGRRGLPRSRAAGHRQRDRRERASGRPAKVHAAGATSPADPAAAGSARRAACVPLPPSISHGVRSPLAAHSPRPFQPAVRIVDAAVEALGVEPDRIRHAQHDHPAVRVGDQAVVQVAGRHRHVVAEAERVVLIDPRVIARLGAVLADALEARARDTGGTTSPRDSDRRSPSGR